MQVGELFVMLGIKPDGSWNKGLGMMRNLRHAALGVAGVFGVKGLAGSLVGFNMKVEDAKNSIAGVLALARKTEFTGELKNANDLYDGLRKKAAELPGTTAEYVDMLKMLAHPMARAGLSNEEMIDTVTGGLTASRGLGENWQKTARDMREFINFGKMNAPDTFARLMFADKDNEKGKKELKAMTVTQRAKLMAERVNQKAMKDLQEAQKNSLSGRLDKLKDTVQVTLGKVGEGLSKALGPALERLTTWLTNNEEKIKDVAATIGDVLVTAFNGLVDAFSWLSDHEDTTKAVLYGIAFGFAMLAASALATWIAVAWPFLAGAAVFAGLFLLFTKLKDVIGSVGAAFATLFAASMALKVFRMVKAVKALTAATLGLGQASSGAAGGGIGGLVGGGAGKSGGLMGALGGLAGAVPNFTGGAPGAGPGGPSFFGGGYDFKQDKMQGRRATLTAGLGKLSQGVPYVAAAMAVHEILDNVIPKGTAGKVIKWFVDPIAKAKMIGSAAASAGSWLKDKVGFGGGGSGEMVNMGEVFMGVLRDTGVMLPDAEAKGAVTSAPVYNVNITGVTDPEELKNQIIAALENSNADSLRATLDALGGNKGTA